MFPQQYEVRQFEYRPSPDQQAPEPVLHPVIVVGAGPSGLALAVDLAQRGVNVLLLERNDQFATGPRALCFAQRTLEIFDRLGCGTPIVERGVPWSVGRVYLGSAEAFSFDVQPEPGHERPPFVNLQQHCVEAVLLERALALPNLEIRWCNTVTGMDSGPDDVVLTVNTPDGPYRVRGGYVAACDGALSPLRALFREERQGRTFRDRFLVADVHIEGLELAGERRFWFDPPFNPGKSAQLHKLPDDVWRVEFQLGWEAHPRIERQPERVLPRVRALLSSLGANARAADLIGANVYTFTCRRMDTFRHGRVLFAGDAAHGMSPFGVRGANSSVQDSDNLAWKLALVARGEAPDALLDSYASEREAAADENIRQSTRATEFVTPKNDISRRFRQAALDLSRENVFARGLVNSGRLSVPALHADSPLGTPDVDPFAGGLVPGAAAVDAPLLGPVAPTWLLRELGQNFALLVFGPPPAWSAGLDVTTVAIDGHRLIDRDGLAMRRYGAQPGTAYLLRPDRHVAARWRTPAEADVRAALKRARAIA